MKKRNFNESMSAVALIRHLLVEYKKNKDEKLLDKAILVAEVHHESLDKQFRKNRRRVATDEINQLIEEMNKQSDFERQLRNSNLDK